LNYSLRLEYRKQGDLRFLSHLDVMGVMERALRRSQLPVAYTEGFNPRPKVASDPALPLGYSSDGEGLMVAFEQAVPGEHVARELNRFLPHGLQFVRWREITPEAPGQPRSDQTRYELLVEGPVPDAESIRGFLARDSVPVELPRKGLVDLRPHVLGIEARGRSLVMTLRSIGSRTVRPEQVLAVLRGSTPEQVPSEEPIHVTKLVPVDDHVCAAMPEALAPSP
jgi:radical SAM-linked protein